MGMSTQNGQSLTVICAGKPVSPIGSTTGGGADAHPTWAPEAFLLQQKVEPWSDLPLWVTATDASVFTFNCAKAAAAGLVTRPAVDTVRDTLLWDRARGTPELKAGITPDREQELLSLWYRTAANPATPGS